MRPKNKDFEYMLLAGEEGNEGIQSSVEVKHQHYSRWYSQTLRGALYLAIVSSLLFNIFHFFLWLSGNKAHVLGDGSVTAYAQLNWDTPGEFEHKGIYDNKDPKITEESWDNLRYDLGSIALSDEYVKSDYDKGLYFLNGYHGVHCLKILRLTLKELFEGKSTTTFHQGHSDHCLEALLQDVVCFADDTPRYTAEDHPGRPGDGQQRKCRDWKKLEAFAQTHTSCWRDINPSSPYLERIHKIFGNFETGTNASKDN